MANWGTAKLSHAHLHELFLTHGETNFTISTPKLGACVLVGRTLYPGNDDTLQPDKTVYPGNDGTLQPDETLTLRYEPKYLVTKGLSHWERTIISCWMSSISSSASSKSMIFIATTCCVLLSMPLKTSPNEPLPIRSSLVKIVSGSTFA